MSSPFSSRLSLALVAAVAVVGCASPSAAQAVYDVRLRTEGQPAGEVSLEAGGYEKTSPFSLQIGFKPEGSELGGPAWMGWTVNFGDYCSDRDSWVQSVVVGPAGQVWRGYRVAVPAGRLRAQDWSSGSNHASGPGAVATPGLLDAIAAGGRFTLALEDDEGRRWNPAVVDIPAPADRQDLFAAAPPPPPPVAGQGLIQVAPPPSAPKSTKPQACAAD